MTKALVTHKDTKTFEKKFTPRDYLASYYPQDVDTEGLFSALRILRKEFRKDSTVNIKKIIARTHLPSEVIENLTLLDFENIVLRHVAKEHPRADGTTVEVGGGPTIYQHIALSLVVKNIIHSEFLKQNRDEIHLWLRNKKSAYNWDAYFHLARKILMSDRWYRRLLLLRSKDSERKIAKHHRLVSNILESENINLYKEHVRERLNKVSVFGDIFKKGLGLSRGLLAKGKADLVSANFVMESATDDYARWEEGMKNAMALVANGELFAMSAIRNSTWYAVGKKRLPAVKITEVDIRNICKQAGFKVLFLRVLTGSPVEEVGYDGMIFILAKKMR